LKYRDYITVESLQKAYELNQKRGNVLIGGNGWLKMQDRQAAKAMDLSALGLDNIEENDDKFVIGCMTTLRDLETNAALDSCTNGAIKESVRHIVGTQFRNCVTVGGSLFGRFGFSDVLTMFLALDCQVELYHKGIISLAEFAEQPYDRDILVRVFVQKTNRQSIYLSFRNQATDFPVLTCACSILDKNLRVVIGARPAKAKVLEIPSAQVGQFLLNKNQSKAENINRFAYWASEQFSYGSNMRGSADYRQHLAQILIKRACTALMEGTDGD
jgi:putative selenate reductase FAD-binding subunit